MNDAEAIFGIFVGMIFVVMALTIPIVYIVQRSRRAQKSMELIHAQRMAAIERGMELPPASLDFASELTRGKPRTALLPGLVWLFVGLAITSSSANEFDDGMPLLFGLIPIGIGLAYLIYYFVEERKTLTSNDASK